MRATQGDIITAPAVDDSCIFHISARSQVEAALASGVYSAPSLATEGFIHLSRAHQVPGVLAAFYAGQPDLVLMVIAPSLLSARLRYEGPAPLVAAPGAPAPPPARAPVFGATELFPHLYGPLNAEAIIDVVGTSSFSGAPVHPDTAALLRHYRFDRLPLEGTLYRSTWRSVADTAQGGPVGTAMLGLYADSPRSVSCFHRLSRDEVWHAYAGDPFVLYLLHPDGHSEQVLMGTDPLGGQQPQCVVPAGAWQAGCLVPGGRHALFGCTMAPGFTGNCFEAGVPEALAAQYPGQAETIHRLAVVGNQLQMPAGFAT